MARDHSKEQERGKVVENPFNKLFNKLLDFLFQNIFQLLKRDVVKTASMNQFKSDLEIGTPAAKSPEVQEKPNQEALKTDPPPKPLRLNQQIEETKQNLTIMKQSVEGENKPETLELKQETIKDLEGKLENLESIKNEPPAKPPRTFEHNGSTQPTKKSVSFGSTKGIQFDSEQTPKTTTINYSKAKNISKNADKITSNLEQMDSKTDFNHSKERHETKQQKGRGNIKDIDWQIKVSEQKETQNNEKGR